jgi:hypothetical protein
MSTGKQPIKREWGGVRDGAGRPARDGGTVKICVSVSEKFWNDALSKWNKPGSHLVDALIQRYIANEVTI